MNLLQKEHLNKKLYILTRVGRYPIQSSVLGIRNSNLSSFCDLHELKSSDLFRFIGQTESSVQTPLKTTEDIKDFIMYGCLSTVNQTNDHKVVVFGKFECV